ncbi:hypothetical protein HUA74_42075 [Myxococcus sp. CA051A]|uniref:hypothetical protein n=1 Tax=unclassified Myxococcus TaxID=2648731 RepID=UPI00157A9182|nr:MULTISPECIES: hypothetical protein [unclassified Myxococcus]NTX06651.1 hypothetical protein [Myxococcus sp. CA040A]NTX67258.1 hypothetical protein [Myxococcus sp. CA051A]
MGIVSIGEVVGSVSDSPSAQQPPEAGTAQATPPGGAPGPEHAEALERQLRTRAWRRTRLTAD